MPFVFKTKGANTLSMRGQAYPHNLLSDIFGEDEMPKPLPADIVETINHVIETLTEREQVCVKARYQESMSYPEIGKLVNVGRQRASQIVSKILRKLRQPTRVKRLRLGDNLYEQLMAESQRKYDEHEMIRRKEEEEYRSSLKAALGDKNAASVLAYEELFNSSRIYFLKISARALNALRRRRIDTVSQLCECTEADLLGFPNCGQKTVSEIKNALNEFGMELKP